jgi:hypothetical protein
MRGCSFPRDFRSQTISAKYFIQNQSHQVSDIWLNMHVDTPILMHQIAHEDEPLINHRNERVRPPPPRIPIRDLLEQIRLLVERLPADLDVHAEVGAHVKRWIDVDQLQSTRVLDLPPERAALER